MREIFTWGRRKKAFYPSGDLNWNNLIPVALQHKNGSSLQPDDLCLSYKSSTDSSLNETPNMPYFLPTTKPLRPSLECLLNIPVRDGIIEHDLLRSPDGVADTGGLTALNRQTPFLSTFQANAPTLRVTDLAAGPHLDLGGFIGRHVASKSKSHHHRRSTPAISSAAEFNQFGFRGTQTRSEIDVRDCIHRHATSSIPHSKSRQIVSAARVRPSPSTDIFRQILINRPAGQKLSLDLDIIKDKRTKKVHQVLVKMVYVGQLSDGLLRTGDLILSMNGLNVTTLTRAQCLKLFQNAPSCFTLMIRRRARPGTATTIEDERPVQYAFTAPRDVFDQNARSCRSPSDVPRKRPARPKHPPPPPPPQPDDPMKVQNCRQSRQSRQSFYDVTSENGEEFQVNTVEGTSTDRNISSDYLWAVTGRDFADAVNDEASARNLLPVHQCALSETEEKEIPLLPISAGATSDTRRECDGFYGYVDCGHQRSRSEWTDRSNSTLQLVEADGAINDTSILEQCQRFTEYVKAPSRKVTFTTVHVQPLMITADTLQRQKESLKPISLNDKSKSASLPNTETIAAASSHFESSVKSSISMTAKERILHRSDLLETSVDEPLDFNSRPVPRKQVTFGLEEKEVFQDRLTHRVSDVLAEQQADPSPHSPAREDRKNSRRKSILKNYSTLPVCVTSSCTQPNPDNHHCNQQVSGNCSGISHSTCIFTEHKDIQSFSDEPQESERMQLAGTSLDRRLTDCDPSSATAHTTNAQMHVPVTFVSNESPAVPSDESQSSVMEVLDFLNENLSGPTESSSSSSSFNVECLSQNLTMSTAAFGDGIFEQLLDLSFDESTISTVTENVRTMSMWSDLPASLLVSEESRSETTVLDQDITAIEFSSDDQQPQRTETPDQLNEAWLNCLKSPWPQQQCNLISEPTSPQPTDEVTFQRHWSVPESTFSHHSSEKKHSFQSLTNVNSRKAPKPIPPPKPQFLRLSVNPTNSGGSHKLKSKLATLSGLASSMSITGLETDKKDTAATFIQRYAPVTGTVTAVTGLASLTDFNEDYQSVSSPSYHSPSDLSISSDPISSIMVEDRTCLEWLRHSSDSGYTGDHGHVGKLRSSPLRTSTSLDRATNSVSSSLSGRTSDSGSDLEYEVDSSLDDERSPIDRSVEILHTSWDIGIKIRLNDLAGDRQQCVVTELMRNSRCQGLSEGDVIRTVNGQSLNGMSELQISTLLRALPRGLVRLTVRDGMERLKLASESFVQESQIEKNAIPVQPAMSDSFSTTATHGYMYNQQSNYGYTQHLPSQSSTIIEPVARSQVSMQGKSSAHIGQPAEFLIKINKLPQNGQSVGNEINTRSHTSSIHYDQSRKPTYDVTSVPLAPLPAAQQATNQHLVNNERRRSYFTDSSTTSDSHDSVEFASKFDSYKMGSTFASDDFKKKREKFLGIGQQEKNGFSDHQFTNGNHFSERKHSIEFSPTERKEFIVPIQREEPAIRGDLFGKYQPISPIPKNQKTGVIMGQYDIPIQREESVVNVVKIETSPLTPPPTMLAAPTFKHDFAPKEALPSSEPAKKVNRVQKEDSPQQTFSSHRTIQTGRKPTATAPPITSTNRSWQDQRGRSSSISSVSSSASLHSYSSADVTSKAAITGKEATAKAQLESRVSSGAGGWVSPALVSRHVPGRTDTGTPSRFSEAMARYKEKTSTTLESDQPGRPVVDKKITKPVVVPVPNKSVHDKANIFEQKQHDAAPVASPSYLSQRSRSLSQNSLFGASAQLSLVNRDHFQAPAVRSQAKILVSPSEEPRAEVPSWNKSSGKTAATIVHDATDRLKPVHHDDKFAARGSRDSGVSSRNSSVATDHDTGASDMFPPPPRMDIEPTIETQVHDDKIPLPAPPTAHEELYPETGKSAVEKKDVTARRHQLPAPMDDVVEPARLSAPAIRATRSPSPGMSATRKIVELVAAAQSNDLSTEDNKQLTEMAKSILGADASTEEVLVIDLVRPDGSTGGGVGLVLTGGADYEVNQIKVNKVISHSLAHRDGRVMAGDRLLLINGQPCSNMTHRQALEVLKSPRAKVTLVLSRPAVGSDSTTMTKATSSAPELDHNLQTVDVRVDRSGLGLTMDGGHSDALTVRRISKGAMSEPHDIHTDAAHHLQIGDELVAVNGITCRSLSRLDCTRLLRSLPEGQIAKLTIRR